VKYNIYAVATFGSDALERLDSLIFLVVGSRYFGFILNGI